MNEHTKSWGHAAGIAAFCAALALGGCGDDGGGADTGMPDGGDAGADTGIDGGDDGGSDAGDGAVDGGDGGTLPACSDDVLDHLLVVTTAVDFSRAGSGALALDDLTTVTAPADLPGADVVADQAGCTGFLIDRALGTLGAVDPSDAPTVTRNLDVTPSDATNPYATNPQGVVAVGDGRAYVLTQARNEIAIVDLSASGTDARVGAIDLSDLVKPGDMDGLVDVLDAIVIGDRAYVALGHYYFDSSFAIHFEGSELAVIDTTTDTLVDVDPMADGVQAIDLAGENPWRGLRYVEADDTLWVGSTGDSFATDGQIEVVSLDTLSSTGQIVTEAELGAEINGFERITGTRVILLVGTDLVSIDPNTDGAPTMIDTDIDGMVLHRGTLWAWARAGDAPGLASFDAATGAETTPGSGRFTFGDLPVFDVEPVP